MATWSVEQEKAWGQKRYGTRVKQYRRKLSLVYESGAEPVSSSVSRSAPLRQSSIAGWTVGMSRRLSHLVDNFHADFRVMLTLTYPAHYPLNGPAVKSHLRALTERARRLGMLKSESWVWWLEFQDRGAPHFHILSTGWIPKAWAAKAWAAVTGGVEAACTRVEGLRKPETAGGYARKYAAKAEQKDVPPGFERVGRMWGMVGYARAVVKEKNSLPLGWPTPYRVATLIARAPDALAWIFRRLWQGLRVYEHEMGFTVFGPEGLLRKVYGWTMRLAAGLFAITTIEEGRLTQRRRRESFATP